MVQGNLPMFTDKKIKQANANGQTQKVQQQQSKRNKDLKLKIGNFKKKKIAKIKQTQNARGRRKLCQSQSKIKNKRNHFSSKGKNTKCRYYKELGHMSKWGRKRKQNQAIKQNPKEIFYNLGLPVRQLEVDREIYDKQTAPHQSKKDQGVVLKRHNHVHPTKELAENSEGPYQIVKSNFIIQAHNLKTYQDPTHFEDMNIEEIQIDLDEQPTEMNIPEAQKQKVHTRKRGKPRKTKIEKEKTQIKRNPPILENFKCNLMSKKQKIEKLNQKIELENAKQTVLSIKSRTNCIAFKEQQKLRDKGYYKNPDEIKFSLANNPYLPTSVQFGGFFDHDYIPEEEEKEVDHQILGSSSSNNDDDYDTTPEMPQASTSTSTTLMSRVVMTNSNNWNSNRRSWKRSLTIDFRKVKDDLSKIRKEFQTAEYRKAIQFQYLNQSKKTSSSTNSSTPNWRKRTHAKRRKTNKVKHGRNSNIPAEEIILTKL